MPVTKNLIIPGAEEKPISLDVFHDGNGLMPVVVYAHGFNGFKDWGNFDLISERFAAAGFTFIKFNFSHNGTTPQYPEDFVDLNAFAENNYTKELQDLSIVLDWVSEPTNSLSHVMDATRIYVIGHSLGGGIAILQAARDARIKKLITWAAVSECKTPWGSWTSDRIEAWRKSGVDYYPNSRTKQQMPMHFQLYEDYTNNQDALSIEAAMKKMNIPILICHGTQDQAVPLAKAHTLLGWQPNARLLTVESDHVFGRSHPWNGQALPQAMETVVEESIAFLN